MEDKLKYLDLLVTWERLRVMVFRELGYGGRPVTPKFRGIASAMAKLQHDLDVDATQLMSKVQGADERRKTVMPKAQAAVASASVELDGIEEWLTEIEQTNAGPLDGQGPRSSDLMKE